MNPVVSVEGLSLRSQHAVIFKVILMSQNVNDFTHSIK